MAKVDTYYHPLLEGILQRGYKYHDKTRDTNIVQISSANIELDLDEFPAMTTKQLYWKGVVAELLWFLKGESNIKFLQDHKVHIWDKDAANFSDTGEVGRNYGVQWRRWSDIEENVELYDKDYPDTFEVVPFDQIDALISGLIKNPMSRRHLVTAWNPGELDETALPPCHWAFEVLPRPMNYRQKMKLSGKDEVYLETLWDSAFMKNDKEAHQMLDAELSHIPDLGFTLKWHQRSVDTFLGLPFNIASYGLLANIIGHLTGMMPISIIGDLSNVHVYEPHVEKAQKQLRNSVIAHKGCQLKVSDSFEKLAFQYRTGELKLSDFINGLKVEDFMLDGYTSFGKIEAEMIAPKL